MTRDHSHSSMSDKELGVIIALCSSAMMFGTLALSYLLGRERFAVWPPLGTEPIPSGLPTLSLLATLFSSYFMHLAISGINSGSITAFRRNWVLSLILGLVFLVLQGFFVVALRDQGLFVAQGLYASMVYLLIGFHASHVLAALGALAWVEKSSRLNPSAWLSKYPLAPKMISWFWHFVGVFWIIFYVLLVYLS